MRILYVASAIEAGGASGGFTHVSEVACGLRALGHQVAVMTRPAPVGDTPRTIECGTPLRTLRPRKELALLGYARIARAARALQPHAIIERFYNFAGAAALVAHRSSIPLLLEVNAPMVDPQGSLKAKVDTVLLGMLRRWAVRQALWSDAIVTPLNTTVPPEVPRARIHELPWGANVDRFDPALRIRIEENERSARELGLARSGPVAVFLGSFRGWHGVGHFAHAARILIERGSDLSFLAIGGGPELEPLRSEVDTWGLPAGRLVFAGAQPHERVPSLLALGDIGVAPFDLSAHEPLRVFGFYWSPLKVFEYMAMGMPVVTVDVAPLDSIVRDGLEGLLYPTGDVEALAGALARLATHPDERARMGEAARERVVAHFSWRAHCIALDDILRSIAHAG